MPFKVMDPLPFNLKLHGVKERPEIKDSGFISGIDKPPTYTAYAFPFPLHPHLRFCIESLKPSFVELCEEHNDTVASN
jgi:hypothetical protein